MLEEIAHHLETELVETEEQLQNEKKKEKQSQLKKKRRTYKKYLRKIQADYLPRKQRYETYNRLFQERNSFSKTDTKTLNLFLDSFLEQHNELPEYIVADAGYGSEENYTYINDVLHKMSLITYASYHKENKKTYRNNPFMVDNWCYLEEKDTYICPNQRAVPFKRYSRRKDTGRFVSDFEIYECENCRDCPVRSQCTKAKSEQNRQILVNNTWRYFKAECKKKLLEEKTGSIYRKRKIDVEPVFGHLKAHLAFQRFHLRGKQGAKIDIGLALMALNLRKLGKYTERKRRKNEKPSPILKVIIKIGLSFF